MRIVISSVASGLILSDGSGHRQVETKATLEKLFTSEDPLQQAQDWFVAGEPCEPPADRELLAPIDNQEVWASGVTYLRSKSARVAESKDAGADIFYDLVYDAERPELFFKATSNRVVGPGGNVAIRSDSTWDVPEPELTLAISSTGKMFGYTIGNDMSSRSIEGENPLYLPQAKMYSRSAGLGPVLVLTDEEPDASTAISLTIDRGGNEVFAGATEVGQIKRSLPSLADWLFRENEFPAGVYLMTGTGVVPEDDFTLQQGDEIRISIDGIGTLHNTVGD